MRKKSFRQDVQRVERGEFELKPEYAAALASGGAPAFAARVRAQQLKRPAPVVDDPGYEFDERPARWSPPRLT